jgi:hypothetical protein
MGIPTAAMSMGYPGAMIMGNMGHVGKGYADVKDNGFSLSGSYGGFSGGIKTDDNSTVCDSRGNCMITDKLKRGYRDSFFPTGMARTKKKGSKWNGQLVELLKWDGHTKKYGVLWADGKIKWIHDSYLVSVSERELQGIKEIR